MALLDATGYDPLRKFSDSQIPPFLAATQPSTTGVQPTGAAQPATSGLNLRVIARPESGIPSGLTSGTPVTPASLAPQSAVPQYAPPQAATVVPFSSLLASNPRPSEYGGNLQPGDPGKKAWQSWVGSIENTIAGDMARGEVITGAPRMFQGDINVLNRYGQYGITPSGRVPTGTGADPGYRQATPDEMAALNAYQNFAYGEENKPGGGAVNAWGSYQGFGPNTAAGNWGGAFSAFNANRALGAGISPAAWLGHALGPGEQTSDPAMRVNGGYLANNNQLLDQYGIPVGAQPGNGLLPDTLGTGSQMDVYQTDIQNGVKPDVPAGPLSAGRTSRAALSQAPVLPGFDLGYDPYKRAQGATF